MSYRSNQAKFTDVLKALKADPTRSNYAIAQACFVSECTVRRARIALESAAFLTPCTVRQGCDGKEYALPQQVTV